tara:strand:+ start:1196 stop:1501 length:306 start_codon:yes stop_codon:yes gene_type:complete
VWLVKPTSKKNKSPGLYVVRWLDILSDPSWHSGSVSKAEPATCITVGWLVFENDKKIILADSRAKDGDWGGLTIIPIGVVASRTRISGRAPESFMKGTAAK